MSVSVEQSGALGRRLTVTIPGERIEDEVARRLEGVARKVKIKGFRPGKAPAKIVRQQYGESVRSDVIDELVHSHYAEAVNSEKLAPVAAPAFQPGDTAADGSYTFTAEIEVYPDFEPAGIADLRLERPHVEITDEDVDEVLERLRRQRGEWRTAERPAADGDRVVIDFEGRVDGEPFEGNTATGMPLVLGAGEVIPGFEEALVGAVAGETRPLDLVFPQDYRKSHLAGRPVRFEVTVHAVEALELPDLDDAFAGQLGIEDGGLKRLRERVRANMKDELEERIRSDLRRQAGDALVAANAIEVPRALVDEEIAREQRAALRRLGISPEGTRVPKFPREPFEEEAERRVRLGLVLSRLVDKEAFRPDPARVQRKIEALTADAEDPASQARALRADDEAMRRIEALVLEETAYDWLIEQAQVEEVPHAFFEFIEPEKGENQ